MSCVLVSVGQCGTQICSEFMQQILECHPTNRIQLLTAHRDMFRSIHVDSEPKPIWRLQQRFRKRLDQHSLHFTKAGRGANWAMGYYGLPHLESESDLAEAVLESIRCRSEQCDVFGGVCMMHSLSGGTGSGLGSRLSEMFKDEFSDSFLVNCVVSPHLSGESPLQYYNAVLCLGALQNSSDAIFYIQNDNVLSRISSAKKLASRRNALHSRKSSQPDGNSTGISLQEINCSIANSLIDLWSPSYSSSRSSYFLPDIPLEIWETVKELCPMTNRKIISLHHRRETTDSPLESAFRSFLRSLNKFDSNGQYYRCLAAVVVFRGFSDSAVFRDSQSICSKVTKDLKLSDNDKRQFFDLWWNSFLPQSNPTNASIVLGNSIAMATNYGDVLDALSKILDRSLDMKQAGAYLHWYKRHGMEEDRLHLSCETVKNIISNYSLDTFL